MDPLTIHCVPRIPGYQGGRGWGKPSRQGYRPLQTEGLCLCLCYMCVSFHLRKGCRCLQKKKKSFKNHWPNLMVPKMLDHLYYLGNR